VPETERSREGDLSTTTQGATDFSADKTAFVILAAISFCHLLNDMMQSLLPAIYPILKSNYNLDFGQIGVITFTWQITASLLQPIIGSVIDRRPKPYSLAVGMGFTLMGLVLLSVAGNFGVLLLAAALVGTGSAVFHPESSRVARMASGGRHGLAQSVFQVGGNAGSAIGPLLAAFIVLRYGQTSVAWFALAALLGIFLLTHVGHWYKLHGLARIKARASRAPGEVELPRGRVAVTIAVLIALIFSKFFYMASMTSYYTFYLIHGFGVSVHTAQIHLFVFLAAVAVGTVAGGPIGDRFGRKAVIWASILGVLPFTLALPYANLFWTGVLSVPIGVILASAFPAIVVYAQELLPKRVGAVAGLFFGLAFGLGGIGAAVLGELADATSIDFVFHICAFLPAIGLLAAFLPHLETESRRRRAQAVAVDMLGSADVPPVPAPK
jgi:FSR family fosmidomycin resistance protein-like MFS transporter